MKVIYDHIQQITPFEYLKCLGSHNLLDLCGFQQIHVQREVMAVTLMLFVRLPKALTSAHVKQALKEMGNTVKVIVSSFCSYLLTDHLSVKLCEITKSGCVGIYFIA